MQKTFDKELEKMGTDRGKADAIRTKANKNYRVKNPKKIQLITRNFLQELKKLLKPIEIEELQIVVFTKMQDIKEDFRKRKFRN